MANLQEINKWDSTIYQIEENDPVQGGADGVTNKPLKQLANRTQFLKKQISDVNTSLNSKEQTLNASIKSLANKISGDQTTQNNNINARLLTTTFNTSQNAQNTKITKNTTDIANINQYNIAQDKTIATKANKSYVDDELNKKLNKTGDTATGRINFNGALGSNDIYSIGNSSIRMRADIACDFYANNQKRVYINESKMGVMCDIDFNNMMICSNIATNNYDGFWHDDNTNTWYFQSDSPRKATTNLKSTIKAADFETESGESLKKALQINELSATQNLNDLKGANSYGIYFQTANARALANLNYPVKEAGTLQVLPSVAGGHQIYRDWNNGIEYWRYELERNRGWSEWQKGANTNGLNHGMVQNINTLPNHLSLSSFYFNQNTAGAMNLGAAYDAVGLEIKQPGQTTQLVSSGRGSHYIRSNDQPLGHAQYDTSWVNEKILTDGDMQGRFIKKINHYDELAAGSFIQLPSDWKILIFHVCIHPNANEAQFNAQGFIQFQSYYFRTSIDKSPFSKTTLYARAYVNEGSEVCYFEIAKNDPTKLVSTKTWWGRANDNSILIYTI